MTANKKYQFTIVVVIVLLFAGIGISNIKNAIAQFNITGTWKGNDGAAYYVRQVGSNIFWLGLSGNDDGRSFSNVFKGTIQGNTIVGFWADVPRGKAVGYGTLTLQISSNSQFYKLAMTGTAFRATFWQKVP
jgi:hypothetical protein